MKKYILFGVFFFSSTLFSAGQGLRDSELVYSYFDSEASDINGWTDLHHAVNNCDLERVIVLLNQGAHMFAATNKKETPLAIAKRKQKDLIEWSDGTDYDDKAFLDYDRIIELLVEHAGRRVALYQKQAACAGSQKK
ncbi:hypothetical protein K2W90_05125 [Candidatus Babeliales bacterium]|nr:hypothetical protein [Candidatus Babeliales bacterium]